MCGRATLTEVNPDVVAEALEAEPTEAVRAGWRPRWNAAPGDRLCVAVQRDRRVLDLLRWGLPGRGGQLLVNLRAETAARRTPGRRCVLPVDGFYEWGGQAGARLPRWFHPAGGGLLRLAAIWGETPAGPGFAVLTVPASGLVAALHDRMPAILPPEALGAWLAGADVPLSPAPPGLLAARDVSPRVNSVAFDDPSCLDPPPAGQPKQLGLFQA